MRSILRAALAALAAILALAAVATSSALASPEWYVKKGGTFKKVTTAVKVEFEASKLAMIETETGFGSGFYRGMSCTSPNLGSGTVESGGSGKIENFIVNEPSRYCKGGKLRENSETNLCKENGIESDGWVHIPWKTSLYTEGATTRATIASGGAGAPYFKVGCEMIEFLGKTSFECGVSGNTHMGNNATAGLVEAEFDTKSPKTECYREQSGAGEWKGVFKIKPSAAEKTAGVEAIKVE